MAGPGRGGRRKPKPGGQYPNRVDLRKQPIRVAPGQTYGMATQQTQAQQAIPLAQGAPTGPAIPPTTQPGLGQGPLPGELGPLHAPTGRPDEPLTHGLPTGPGAGPEVLQPPDPLTKAAAVLNAIGSNADPVVTRLRAQVNAQLYNSGAA